MNWMHILHNINTDRFFGSTNNLDRRLKQHKAGLNRTTRVLQTLELVYKEAFETIDEAGIRERKLE